MNKNGCDFANFFFLVIFFVFITLFNFRCTKQKEEFFKICNTYNEIKGFLNKFNFTYHRSSTKYIVKAGDFCQVGRYTYIATEDVQRGSSTTVNIPVHRNLLTEVVSPINAVIGEYGTTISMGGSTYTGITFPVILREYPTYTLVPMTNDSFISWSGQFKAFESVL
jgi:hypothetical protein